MQGVLGFFYFKKINFLGPYGRIKPNYVYYYTLLQSFFFCFYTACGFLKQKRREKNRKWCPRDIPEFGEGSPGIDG